jgi:teichuronic acid biosynthesis glycosyltransferase TuaC
VLRVLSISTLFPNAARPSFGLFVARQAEAVARHNSVEMVVINPQALAPPPFDRFINSPQERALPVSAFDWGVTVHYPRFTWIPRFGPRWNPWLIARAVLPLARRLHAEKPFDLVDAQFFYPDGPAAARVAKALGLPLSIKSRGSDIILWGGKPFASNQMLAAAEQAVGLLAVSEALKRDMVALGMPGDKITVHYTGLDHTRFRPMPRAQARMEWAEIAVATGGKLGPAGGKMVATVGYLVPVKGQELVIRALASLPDVQSVLAGTGPDEAKLRTLAKELGIADRVHFAGSLQAEQLAVLLNAADAMVLPSEREGLANVWVESLACGTPLVITDVGGAREVVRDASAGRIVERSPEAIAAGIRELLASTPVQQAVAANAARFSWDENAAQLAAYYQRLTSKT